MDLLGVHLHFQVVHSHTVRIHFLLVGQDPVEVHQQGGPMDEVSEVRGGLSKATPQGFPVRLREQAAKGAAKSGVLGLGAQLFLAHGGIGGEVGLQGLLVGQVAWK